MADADKPTARVFISHSSTDKRFALLISQVLREREFSPWIDSEQIKTGETIIERIGTGLRTMDVLTMIASKASISSRWVAEELSFALQRSIKDKQVILLPFIIEDDLALDELPWFLRARRVE